MSGFAAFVDTAAGGRATAAAAQAMMAAQGYRASGGEGVLADGPAALGHGLVRIGPADRVGPFRDRARRFILACDARLDAVGDLRRRLSAPMEATDADLLLAAYAAWGEEMAERIDGDFAFVVWDAGRRQLHGARDRFGVKPFAFGGGPRGVAAASDPRAVLAGLGAAAVPDERWVAEFLAGQPTDPALTPWAGVMALPPGHALTVSDGRVAVRAYWRLEAAAPPPRRDRPAQLRALLAASVADRTAASGTGVMLSGGLDSSSIAALAADIRPMDAFTLGFPAGSPFDEGRHAAAVAAGRPLRPHRVDAGDPAPFADWAEMLAEQGAPFLGPGLSTMRPLYRAARAAGATVLLDGHGGDEVISCGYERLELLARHGRLLSLWRNVRGAAALSGRRPGEMFLDLTLRQPVLARLRRRSIDPAGWRRIVTPGLAERSDLVGRVRAHRAPRGLDAHALHASLITAPIVPHALEVLDRQALQAGVTPRYPFLSRPLVEFCVSLPPEEKLAQGQTRRILRRAMAGVLPEEVRLRRDKVNFAPRLGAGLQIELPFLTATLARAEARLADYVAIDVARGHLEAVGRFGADVPFAVAAELWRAVWLALWLGSLEGWQTAPRMEAAE